MKWRLLVMGALAVVAGCSREPPAPGEPPGETALSEGETILREHLKQHRPSITPGTPEYGVFIKDVLWDVYPELSAHPKKDEIRRFATEYVNRPDSPAR
ncbi:hypothetical protein [Sorangium cellulosum]|uniref:Uncharacterized protein n=1 Tax=Sorangium cellulosum TaxID=56 RepID=A0A150R1C9_SORCE|nr:hypothetical protein [Sorangium cellulosum]KYF74014.1 hypothetical protein BE15_43190 [Sorangium cellulosum]